MKKLMSLIFVISFSISSAMAGVQDHACFKSAVSNYKKNSETKYFEFKTPFLVAQNGEILDFYGHLAMVAPVDVVVFPVHSNVHSGYAIEALVLNANTCEFIALETIYSE